MSTSDFFGQESSFFPSGGGVAGGNWRLLTAADFGAIVEGTAGQGITLTDSGDPLYPVRLTYTSTGAVVSNVCWPVIGAAKTALDRQTIANPIIRAKATTFPAGGATPYTGFGFGTFDGAIATAIAGGLWFQAWNPTTWRVGKFGLTGAIGMVTANGWMDFATEAEASQAYVFSLIRDRDNGTNLRQFMWTIGDASLTPTAGTADSVTAGVLTGTALTAGTREWCLMARKGASNTTSVTDLAFWIMDPPPPSPYVPQP